jgi:alpha-tubulin suppressor-like RCC1 family protein
VSQTSGQLSCVGYNESFQIGPQTSTTDACWPNLADTKCAEDFQPIADVTNARAVAGGASHTCVIRAPGSIYCVGSNEFGQLGVGSAIATGAGNFAQTFGQVFIAAGFGDTKQFSLGSAHSCSLQQGSDPTSMRLWCWGNNDSGQIGPAGGAGLLNAPGVVAGTQAVPFTGLLGLATGNKHTCVLTSDHRVFCFGRNDKAQLGQDPTRLDMSAQPIEVAVPTPVAN